MQRYWVNSPAFSMEKARRCPQGSDAGVASEVRPFGGKFRNFGGDVVGVLVVREILEFGVYVIFPFFSRITLVYSGAMPSEHPLCTLLFLFALNWRKLALQWYV